jgi:hypothetical protein
MLKGLVADVKSLPCRADGAASVTELVKTRERIFRSAGAVVMGFAATLSGSCAMTRYQPAPLIPADSAAANASPM